MFALLAIWNVCTFTSVIIDKRKSIRGDWRISENTLFMAALLWGAAGVLIGMYAVRHKTRHFSFRIGIPLLMAVNILSLIYFRQIGWL